HRTIERAAIPFDDAHHEMNARIARDFTDTQDFGAGQINGGLEIATKILTSLRRAAAQPRTKIEPFRIAANEGFGKHDQIRVLAGGIAVRAASFSIVLGVSKRMGAA